MNRRSSYTLESLKSAVESSYSVGEVLIKLGLVAKGGNYKTFRKLKEMYNLDTSHFCRKTHSSKGKTRKDAFPLDKILVNNFPYGSDRLKKRLIKEGIKEHKCEECQLTEWMGKPIPLELEHIDGDHFNNLLENLKVLCPNCHANTSTYRGRKQKGKTFKSKQTLEPDYKCLVCGIPVKTKSKTGLCCSCSHKTQRKVERPPMHQLIKEIKETSYLAVGKKYGVSDNAIRKWIATDADFYALVA